MTLTPIENPSTAPIPPLRAEILLAPETVMALAQEIARVIIGFLKILIQEAQAEQEKDPPDAGGGRPALSGQPPVGLRADE